MVNTDNGTLLGKCAIDGQPIFEGMGFRSRHSTIVNGKWISGDTMLKLYKTSFEAFLDEHKDAEAEKIVLLERLGKYGWQTNPETGKLFKISNETKALNRTATIRKKVIKNG